MCGTMMPTKPISPTAETIAAVPSEDAAMTMRRTRRTGRPSDRDSSSPTLITSSARPATTQTAMQTTT